MVTSFGDSLCRGAAICSCLATLASGNPAIISSMSAVGLLTEFLAPVQLSTLHRAKIARHEYLYKNVAIDLDIILPGPKSKKVFNNERGSALHEHAQGVGRDSSQRAASWGYGCLQQKIHNLIVQAPQFARIRKHDGYVIVFWHGNIEQFIMKVTIVNSHQHSASSSLLSSSSSSSSSSSETSHSLSSQSLT